MIKIDGLKEKLHVRITNDNGVKSFYLYALTSTDREYFETDIQDFLVYSGNDSIDISIFINGYQLEYFNNYNDKTDKTRFKIYTIQKINLIIFTMLYSNYEYNKNA